MLTISFFFLFTGELNGEVMAVKMVRSEHSTEALREIETMACFSHPNILPLLGIAKSPGKYPASFH